MRVYGGSAMGNDDFWSSVYSASSEERHQGRYSIVRIALLFGTAAVAFALIIPPMIDTSYDDWEYISHSRGLDYTTTATVPRSREYTVQRSVLQPLSSSVCIIEPSGRQTGDC